MSRSLLGGVLASAVLTLTTTGCAGAPAAEPAATASPAPAATASPAAAATVEPVVASPEATADRGAAPQRAEDTFVTVTAAHLCTVQSTVYDDPKALAAAYAEVPTYPGLRAEQVTAFRARAARDKAFAARVYARLQATCKPGTR